MRPASQPGPPIDPGWLFVAAGLVMCAAVILIPAGSRLEGLREQLPRLEREEALLLARLRAHANFLDELDRGDPPLVRRLAAAQFNVVSAGERPVLVARSSSASVTERIDGAIEPAESPSSRGATSLLSRLTEGPYRLWLLGASILSIFIGLLIGPGESVRRRTAPERSAPPAAHGEGEGGVDEDEVRHADEAVGSPAEPCRGRARPVVSDAPSARLEASTGALLLGCGVEDEADIIDEDEVESRDGATGNPPTDQPLAAESCSEGRPRHEAPEEVAPAPAATAAPRDPAENPTSADEEPDALEDGDEDEWEYEYVYEEVEEDDPAAGDDAVVDDDYDEEFECVDAEESVHGAVDADADDGEYEYVYEYVYVDEDEEGEVAAESEEKGCR